MGALYDPWFIVGSIVVLCTTPLPIAILWIGGMMAAYEFMDWAFGIRRHQ